MANKQTQLNGMERPSIPEVEKAAETYRGARDARMLAMVPEKEAKVTLMDAMKKHKLKEYRYEGENGEGETVEFEVERTSKETVKVRSAKEKDEGDGDEDESED